MRLLDCISSVNSRQGIELVELEHTNLLDRDGIVLRASVFAHLELK